MVIVIAVGFAALAFLPIWLAGAGSTCGWA
jgi:hypothetical protein